MLLGRMGTSFLQERMPSASQRCPWLTTFHDVKVPLAEARQAENKSRVLLIRRNGREHAVAEDDSCTEMGRAP